MFKGEFPGLEGCKTIPLAENKMPSSFTTDLG